MLLNFVCVALITVVNILCRCLLWIAVSFVVNSFAPCVKLFSRVVIFLSLWMQMQVNVNNELNFMKERLLVQSSPLRLWNVCICLHSDIMCCILDSPTSSVVELGVIKTQIIWSLDRNYWVKLIYCLLIWHRIKCSKDTNYLAVWLKKLRWTNINFQSDEGHVTHSFYVRCTKNFNVTVFTKLNVLSEAFSRK